MGGDNIPPPLLLLQSVQDKRRWGLLLAWCGWCKRDGGGCFASLHLVSLRRRLFSCNQCKINGGGVCCWHGVGCTSIICADHFADVSKLFPVSVFCIITCYPAARYYQEYLKTLYRSYIIFYGVYRNCAMAGLAFNNKGTSSKSTGIYETTYYKEAVKEDFNCNTVNL